LSNSVEAGADSVLVEEDPETHAKYKMYYSKNDLTIANNEPVFVGLDHKTSAEYNS